jgi:hypothetical protein
MRLRREGRLTLVVMSTIAAISPLSIVSTARPRAAPRQAPTRAATEQGRCIRALIVSGGCCHDYARSAVNK